MPAGGERQLVFLLTLLLGLPAVAGARSSPGPDGRSLGESMSGWRAGVASPDRVSTDPAAMEKWEGGRVALLVGECGDGTVDVGEDCDDGGTEDGDCCSSTCAFETLGSSCGDAGDECTIADACDGAGACTDNGFQPAETPCGDATDTACSNPDTCDGSGSCQANDEPDGTSCRWATGSCDATETCSGGECPADGHVADGTLCNDGDPLTEGESCGGGICSCAPGGCDFNCGDGVLDAGEECDDGGTVAGDGCSDLCRTEVAQTKDQQKCINVVNSLVVKLAQTQTKENSLCLRDGGRGKLPPGQSIAECLSADRAGKLAGVVEKLEVAQDGLPSDPAKTKCPQVPGFGYASAAVIGSTVPAITRDFFADTIGKDPDGEAIDLVADSTQSKAAGCQKALVNGAAKILFFQTREFVGCKKTLLKDSDAPALSAADLEACMVAMAADPKGKVEKMRLKLDGFVEKKCEKQGVAWGDVLAGACAQTATTPAEFSTCMVERGRCRACQMFNLADGLRADCDALDDGVENQSCEVPVALDEELLDGTTYVGVDGVMAGAVVGALEAPLRIGIERVEPPATPLSDGFVPRGFFYRIGAERDVVGDSTSFFLGLPAPAGGDPAHLALAVHHVEVGHEGLPAWGFLPGVFDAALGSLLVPVRSLPAEGFTAVVVEHPGLESPPNPTTAKSKPQSAAVNSVSFKLECAMRDPGGQFGCETFADPIQDEFVGIYREFKDTGWKDPILPKTVEEVRTGNPPEISTSSEYTVMVKETGGSCDKNTPGDTQVLGFYGSEAGTLQLCIAPNIAGITPGLRALMRHEYFHALQWAYKETEKERWLTEGTATLAEKSVHPKIEQTRPAEDGFDFFQVDVVGGLRSGGDVGRYQAQDFWAHVLRQGGPGLAPLQSLFEHGRDLKAIKRWFGGDQGLGDAYWEWSKDQAMAEGGEDPDLSQVSPCEIHAPAVEKIQEYGFEEVTGFIGRAQSFVLRFTNDSGDTLQGVKFVEWLPENDDFIEYKSYRATESCPPPDGERSDENAFDNVYPGEEFVVLVSRKDFEGPAIRKFVISIQTCTGSSCI